MLPLKILHISCVSLVSCFLCSSADLSIMAFHAVLGTALMGIHLRPARYFGFSLILWDSENLDNVMSLGKGWSSQISTIITTPRELGENQAHGRSLSGGFLQKGERIAGEKGGRA